MAKPKSTSGGKSKAANTNKEQINTGNPASAPEVKVVAAGTTPAEGAAAEAAAAEGAAKVKSAPKPKKNLEVVKSEPRKNVVPINRVPVNLEDEIRRRAYELYQQRGGAAGSAAEDWLAAEREVRQRHQKQQSA